MAAADYYLCDVCDCKCFYDANLNYQFPDKDGLGDWGQPISDELIRGRDMKLDYCGDMACICLNCSKNYEVYVRLIGESSHDNQ